MVVPLSCETDEPLTAATGGSENKEIHRFLEEVVQEQARKGDEGKAGHHEHPGALQRNELQPTQTEGWKAEVKEPLQDLGPAQEGEDEGYSRPDRMKGSDYGPKAQAQERNDEDTGMAFASKKDEELGPGPMSYDV